jgi:hypothetical protein
MSILNRPSDGLLSVLLSFHRALLAYGPQTESRLLELCSPASVVPEGKPDMARKTLTRWKQLAFFRDADGRVELSPAMAEVAADDIDKLRAAILRLVLGQENSPALVLETEQDHEGSKASDFARAAAWVLAQDLYSFPDKWEGGVEALQNEQAVKPKPFTNDTRWQGFAEWSVFLGIACTTTKQGITPNPSFAVRSVLTDVFAGRTELSQQAFLDQLGNMLPIIDGGRYRVLVEEQTKRPWTIPQHNQISPSLSAALLTLEAKGAIALQTRSDAQQRLLLGASGRELRPISHIVFQGALSC